MNYAIRVENLRKSYTNGHEVLKGISFQVNQGEIFALLGLNGAGKTTTLECVEGLRKYDSGTVQVNGKVGIQLQASSLPEHMKAMEAVKLFAKWNKVPLDKEMLRVFGIDELKNKQYAQMSTGQKRRLHLVLALVRNPKIVFLDEPTAGLDVEARMFLHEEIKKLKAQSKTIIMSSHDMSEVESLCDKIAILRNGQIAFYGTAEELKNTFGHQCVIEIKTDKGTDSFKTDDIRDTLQKQLEEYKNQDIKVLDVKVNKGTLEELFVHISRGE